MILETSWIPEEEKKKIYLAAEEIFVNICHYAYNGREEGTAKIDLMRNENMIELRFADSGVPY